MLSHFEKVSLDDLSNLECTFLLGDDQSKYAGILMIRFSGEYRHGCAGNPDGQFMVAMRNAGVGAFNPYAVILDLSSLKYQWGDMLDSAFGSGGRYLPWAVVVGEGCRRAIETLGYGWESDQEPSVLREIFYSLEHACDYLVGILEGTPPPAIHAAAQAGDLAEVQRLLDEGESPRLTDWTGKTPLHVTSDVSVARLLIESGARRDSVHGIQDPELARLLLNAGADADYKALAEAKSADLASVLLTAGAHVHLSTRNTLLHQNANRPDLVKLYLEAGADVNTLNDDGDTPLDVVEKELAKPYAEVAAILRSNGGLRAKELHEKADPSHS